MKSPGYVVKGTPEKILRSLVTRRAGGAGSEPLPAGAIASRLGINKRSVFAAINELRHAGHPIARAPEGYFFAVNADELEGTIRRLEAEALEMVRVVRDLRSIYQREEADQYTLLIK